jgi:hypothetical protein
VGDALNAQTLHARSSVKFDQILSENWGSATKWVRQGIRRHLISVARLATGISGLESSLQGAHDCTIYAFGRRKVKIRQWIERSIHSFSKAHPVSLDLQL